MSCTKLSLLLVCLLPVMAPAAERRQSGEDTERHPSIRQIERSNDRADRRDGAAARLVTPSARAGRRSLLEDIDPAVRQYWSDKCVQQRARGWGHTGDCNHPAYAGGSYRPRTVIVPYPVRSQPEPGRRPGHLGIRQPRPGGRGHLR